MRLERRMTIDRWILRYSLIVDKMHPGLRIVDTVMKSENWLFQRLISVAATGHHLSQQRQPVQASNWPVEPFCNASASI